MHAQNLLLWLACGEQTDSYEMNVRAWPRAAAMAETSAGVNGNATEAYPRLLRHRRRLFQRGVPVMLYNQDSAEVCTKFTKFIRRADMTCAIKARDNSKLTQAARELDTKHNIHYRRNFLCGFGCGNRPSSCIRLAASWMCLGSRAPESPQAKIMSLASSTNSPTRVLPTP